MMGSKIFLSKLEQLMDRSLEHEVLPPPGNPKQMRNAATSLFFFNSFFSGSVQLEG